MHEQGPYDEPVTRARRSENNMDEHAVQSAVKDIWAALLGLKHVELADNFLLLGGESLLAVQAASRIRELFNYELSIRSIFTRSVAEIASEIVARRGM